MLRLSESPGVDCLLLRVSQLPGKAAPSWTETSVGDFVSQNAKVSQQVIRAQEGQCTV